MKIIFAGTPEFAAQAMRAIYDAGHEIVLALTQPDRRAGRGMRLQASPVKEFAVEKNIPVIQPSTLRRNVSDEQKRMEAEQAYQRLSTLDFDAMVVVAYGLILPQEILDISEQVGRYGSFNIHASLLPRWRGAAPIQRAIESGDDKTGVCIMQMDAGLDTGDVVLIEALDIAPTETAASLHDRLASLGARLIVQTLAQLQEGEVLSHQAQPNTGITYAEKILKSEAEINWQLDAPLIDARIRAFNPFPGATSNLVGVPVKIWNSRLADDYLKDGSFKPGQIVDFSEQGVVVACGSGFLEMLEMQKPGGKRLSAKACIQSFGSSEKSLCFQAKAQNHELE